MGTHGSEPRDTEAGDNVMATDLDALRARLEEALDEAQEWDATHGYILTPRVALDVIRPLILAALEEITADRDSWAQQAEDRCADLLRVAAERDGCRRVLTQIQHAMVATPDLELCELARHYPNIFPADSGWVPTRCSRCDRLTEGIQGFRVWCDACADSLVDEVVQEAPSREEPKESV